MSKEDVEAAILENQRQHKLFCGNGEVYHPTPDPAELVALKAYNAKKREESKQEFGNRTVN